jgi:hypothetical protein
MAGPAIPVRIVLCADKGFMDIIVTINALFSDPFK